MALYIPQSILHLARSLYVRPETYGPTYVYVDSRPTMSWKNHAEQITHKLSAACYTLKSVISQETLKMVYYAYVHSIMNYRIIFWGNSSQIAKIF